MILELLKKRRSVRLFSEKEIDKEVINYMLECGRLSPSGGNEQPWKFGVITDKDTINKITNYCYNQKWISNAKLLIVLCSTIVNKNKGGRDIQIARFPELKDEIQKLNDNLYNRLNLEEHQTKIAGTHMVLAGLEKGVTSTWVSYFDVDMVSKLLNLPNEIIASEIIVFGYPKEKSKSITKKELENIVFFNNFKG